MKRTAHASPVPEATEPTEPEPKRRASAACQYCRTRKTKCDARPGQMCSACRQSNLECVLDVDNDRRKTGSKKQIQSLQERILTLESLLGQSSSEAPMHIGVDASSHTEAANDIRDTIVCAAPLAPEQQPPNDKGEAYFGPTSASHVRLPNQQSPAPTAQEIDTSSDEPTILGMAMDLHSPQLRNNLLRGYFKYQPLWLSVVDKDLFMVGRAKGVPSKWYSNFLESVLLASAARLSTSATVRAIGQEYAREAHEGILPALESPSVASLQGFLLLSEYEVTQGHDRLGWMLCGMACRMAPDIGLHHLSADSTTSTPKSTVYFNLLCACITYDGIWCLYLGRPACISPTITNATRAQCQNSTAQNAKMARAWVELCATMAEVNEILNHEDSDDKSGKKRLQDLEGELHTWNRELPKGIRYADDKDLTGMESTAYGLQTQYCKICILLHDYRTFPSCQSRKRKRSSPGATSEEALDDNNNNNQKSSSSSSSRSRAIVRENAIRIAKLLFNYREIFGTEEIPSITLDNALVAAMSLIHLSIEPQSPSRSGESQSSKSSSETSDSNSELKENRIWLKTIVDTLEAVHQHFPITKRMLRSLEQEALNTPLASLFTLVNLTSGRDSEANVSSERILRSPPAVGAVVASAKTTTPTTNGRKAEREQPVIPQQLQPSHPVLTPASPPPPSQQIPNPSPTANFTFDTIDDMSGSLDLSSLTPDPLLFGSQQQHRWPQEDELVEAAASAFSWGAMDFMSSMLGEKV